MKHNWQTKTLGEVLEIERGGSPRPIKSFLTTASNGINWVKIGDTQGIEKYIYKTEEKIKPEGAKRSRIVNEGDFILSNSMSFGRPYIMRTTGCIHDGWLVLRDKAKHLDQDFLYYLLSSDEVFRQFNRLAAGATVRNLNINLVRGVSISFPESLPEQRRIVAKLDDIFARIATAKANAEKNLANAREVFESYLQSVFANPGKDWKQRVLGDIAEVQTGGTPLRSTKQYWNGNLPWYSSGELNRLYTSAPERFITKAGLENSNAKMFPTGSLLVGIYDTAALKMSILDRDASFNQAIAGIKPNNSVDLIFIRHAINAQKANLLNLRRGTRQKNLSLAKIKEITLPIPSLNEQRSIVSELEAVSLKTQRLEAQYRSKLSLLMELKKSVLRQAFSGEL